jgi:mycofactocin system glycosyltransferase
MSAPVAPSLPAGTPVVLSANVRVADDGRTLLGGSPTRALFLTPAAVGLVRDGRVATERPDGLVLADRLVELGLADPVVRELASVDPDDLTFVIPTYGRAPQLDRLLTSIGPGRRVLVVDDVSPDRASIAAVVGRHPGVRMVELPRNVGPAAARNAGLREVTTPYVVFVDTDVVLEPGAVELCARHFVDPRVAAVAPHVRALDDQAPGRSWVRRYEDARSSLDLGGRPASVRPKSVVAWVSSSCLVARTDALGEGFTTGLRVGEDVDLVWRLVEEGWRVRYEPAARVRHEHRDTLRAWLARKAFYGTGADAIARRHPGDVAPAVLAPWSAALLVALLAQRKWSLPVAGVVGAATGVRIARRLRRSERPGRLAVWLTASGGVNAVFQGSGLLLRHWWPAAAVACVFSRRVRRAVLAVAVLDVAVEYARGDAPLDPVRFATLRRLDDLAYGAGVWWGVVRGRSWRALAPEVRWRG